MKIKIGPVELEQDPIKDEVLFNDYKESPKTVEKYLAEKSKYFDMTLKNVLDGKTMRTFKNFLFFVLGTVFFVGWSLYVFYISKDHFVWKEPSLQNTINVFLQTFLILGVCLFPVVFLGGFFKLSSKKADKEK